MKKQRGFTLIEILIALAILIITLAGGVVVWERKVAIQPTPTPTPPQTLVTLTPAITSPLSQLPPDAQSQSRITVTYTAGWFGPCGGWRITYSKVDSRYSFSQKCANGQTGEFGEMEKEISKDEFERSIYLQSYLAKPWEQRSFAKIDKSSLAPGLNLHPDSANCWRSTDKVDLVCGNNQGIIVDHFWDYNAIGVFDKNSRHILETINSE